ncbi:MAG: GtrA family protein [Candidatus Thorarchaeota archaeon]
MRKFGGYMAISVLATLIDVGLLILLVELVGVYYLLAITISYSCSVITKFILNKKTIFTEAEGYWMSQFARFWVVSLTGLAITNVIMYFGVDILLLTYLLSKIGAIGVVFIWTLILHSFFSFKSREVIDDLKRSSPSDK